MMYDCQNKMKQYICNGRNEYQYPIYKIIFLVMISLCIQGEYIVIKIPKILCAVHGIQAIIIANTKPKIIGSIWSSFKFFSSTVNASGKCSRKYYFPIWNLIFIPAINNISVVDILL